MRPRFDRFAAQESTQVARQRCQAIAPILVRMPAYGSEDPVRRGLRNREGRRRRGRNTRGAGTDGVVRYDAAAVTMSFSLVGKRVWIAGHRGMAGSAIVRRLAAERCELVSASREELDLRNQGAVEAWMQTVRPQVVFVAAATVGGIVANDSRPAEFIYDNLAIQTNVIHEAWRAGVKRLLFLGSSCIYPRDCPQPIKEEYLLTGQLEQTNEAYAIAKIAGIKLCQTYRKQYGCDFISAMPTNLYGPFDNFDLSSSHVVPALMRKFHDAKLEGRDEVVVWGTGSPRREFHGRSQHPSPWRGHSGHRPSR
jgi:GDP-L-fucose synthase